VREARLLVSWLGLLEEEAGRTPSGEPVAAEAAAEVGVAALAVLDQDIYRPRKAPRTHLEATVLVGTVARGSSRTSRIPSGIEAHNAHECSETAGRTRRLSH